MIVSSGFSFDCLQLHVHEQKQETVVNYELKRGEKRLKLTQNMHANNFCMLVCFN